MHEILNNKTDITYSKIHLSNSYTYVNDNSKDYKYALEANELAKELKNGMLDCTTLLNRIIIEFVLRTPSSPQCRVCSSSFSFACEHCLETD